MNAPPRIRVQYLTARLASQVDPKAFDDQVVVHYSIPSIQDTGEPAIETASSIESNKLLLRGDEVLVSRLNPHKNCVARVLPDQRPILSSTEFVAFSPARVDPRFLVYSFQSLEASQYLTSRAESATRSHARVDPSDIIKFKIPRFAIEDQQRIADYLDRETAEIDALIAEKGRMLVLLEEKRAALVTRAVTRGLNPHAPLKPSGLEWLGDVPCAWTTHRFKNLFSIRDERSEDGKEELLTVSHISGVTPRSEKTVYMFKAEDMAGYKKCYPGDLITNTLWAFMGALGIARESGIVSPDYHVYEPNNQVDPEFLDLLVRSDVFKTEILRHSKGVWSSRLRLYPEEFFDIRFPLPPIDEQVRAVAEFQTVDKRDRQLTLEIDQSIQLLRERRSALITSAVTGQIPIEEMAG